MAELGVDGSGAAASFLQHLLGLSLQRCGGREGAGDLWPLGSSHKLGSEWIGAAGPPLPVRWLWAAKAAVPEAMLCLP